jgi:hypothetical protein
MKRIEPTTPSAELGTRHEEARCDNVLECGERT